MLAIFFLLVWRLKLAMRHSSSSWKWISTFIIFLLSHETRTSYKLCILRRGLDYCFCSGRPLGPPCRAPAVDSQLRCQVAQHHVQVKPLPLQLDALLGHDAGLPPQLDLHLSHPPHVVEGHIAAGSGTRVPQAGRREGHWGRSLGLNKQMLEVFLAKLNLRR